MRLPEQFGAERGATKPVNASVARIILSTLAGLVIPPALWVIWNCAVTIGFAFVGKVVLAPIMWVLLGVFGAAAVVCLLLAKDVYHYVVCARQIFPPGQAMIVAILRFGVRCALVCSLAGGVATGALLMLQTAPGSLRSDARFEASVYVALLTCICFVAFRVFSKIDQGYRSKFPTQHLAKSGNLQAWFLGGIIFAGWAIAMPHIVRFVETS